MKKVTLRSFTLAMVWATTLLVGGPSAWAGPGGDMGGPFGRDLLSSEHLASELGLSDSQRTAVDKLMDESRSQARPYVRQLMEQHKAMRALTESDNFDEAAVRGQAAQRATIMTELAVLHARNAHELRKILTPAQRQKLQEMRGRHRGR